MRTRTWIRRRDRCQNGLLDLVEQEADADLVREMLAFAAERMMDLEIEAKTGAVARTRSSDRLNHRSPSA